MPELLFGLLVRKHYHALVLYIILCMGHIYLIYLLIPFFSFSDLNLLHICLCRTPYIALHFLFLFVCLMHLPNPLVFVTS